MSEQEVILTREGLKQLEDELENLRSVKRAEVKERLKEAIALGDLSENSEYDDAKNEQAFGRPYFGIGKNDSQCQSH